MPGLIENIRTAQLNNQVLSTADQHLYLGVLLDKKLSWLPHISRTASKATQTLNFLKRNLSTCSTDIKAAAYLSMVGPLMEYAALVWDPQDIQHLEKVQRRAARWALNNYGQYNSVTSTLEHLGWDILLKKAHIITRLQTLFKLLLNDYALEIPHHYLHPTRHTRQYHPQHFIIPNSSTVTYQQSFYSKTINEWNNLPTAIIEHLNLFTDNLLTFL